MKKLAFSVFAAALTFGVNADSSVEVEGAAAQECSGFDGFDFGLGVAAIDNGLRLDYTSGDKDSGHNTRLAATASLGYGKVLQKKAFLGLELGLDAAQNSEFGNAKINGLTPFGALKLGYVHPATKSMIYLKAGAAFSKATFAAAKDKTFKCSKWSPIVALGGEKICGKVRTRLEAEYRFRSNKNIDDKAYAIKKITNRGAVTLRAMAIYTVKM